MPTFTRPQVPDAGLIPRPRLFSHASGAFKPRANTTLSTDPSFAAEADWAVTALSYAFSVPFTAALAGKGDVRVTKVAGLGPEDYRLDIRSGSIRAEASEPAGAFYALQTLRSLGMINGDRAPACHIEDGPRFGYRGYLLDTVRNYFDPTFIKRFIDLAALHKLNRFHWHLTDDQGWRLPVPGHPELTDIGARKVDRRYLPHVERTLFYSEETIRDIVTYAGQRHVTVIPEIEMPGHSLALLSAHPELSCIGGSFEPEDRFGVFADVLCAGNDAVFELLGEILDQCVKLFPGKVIHFGGDEVPTERWAACPRCLARIAGEGLADATALQGWFTRKVVDLLRSRGRMAAGWDEILESKAPEDVIVLAWRSAEAGLMAARLGHGVVMCPGSRACYLDYKHLDVPDEPGHLGVSTVRNSYEFEPLQGFDESAARNVLGIQGNLWTEIMYFGRQVEYMAFPRLSAIAETGWTPHERKSWESFSARLPYWGRVMDRYDVARYRGP
ncbi:MAG: beta-N-acetylhexosaminidase, partial [Spirochaetales bacterium]